MKTTLQRRGLCRRLRLGIIRYPLSAGTLKRYMIGVFTLVILAGFQVKSQSNKSVNGFDLVDKNGNIRKPSDYRDKYQTLGTYTVLDPKGDQMHVTYAPPGTTEYYRK